MKKFLLSIFAVLFAFAGAQAQSYVKVTSAPVDWSGDYLIVYEAGNVAFDGGLSTLDATSNTISVTISDGKILATDATNAAKFTIVSKGDGTYTVKSASGYYIGRNSAKNGLDSNPTTAYTNTITYTDGKVVIASSNKSDYSLQYNKTSGQTRFRYFGSAQEAIALYKYVDAEGGETQEPEVGLPAVSVDDKSTIALGDEIIISPAVDNTVTYSVNNGASIQITETTTITADKAGVMTLSVTSECNGETLSAKYTFYVMPNAPEFTPAAGSFEDESLEVEIVAEDADEIYYTLDGSEPTVEDATLYVGPFEITATTTVKAIAVVDDVASIVASATYKYVDPNLVISNSTISFANTTQRVSQTTTQQVWSNGTINFTNNKSASQSNVVDSSNPVKCYASSSITLECVSGNITEILFDCNSTSYATALNNSFDNTVISTVSGDKVTVTLDGTSNTFTIEKLSAQVRMDAVTVTYATEGETLSAPILPESQYFSDNFEVIIEFEDGADVYYTLNGNDPTKESILYEGSFTITETTIVKAIAVKGELVSTPAMAKYTKTINLSDCTVAEVIEAYANGQTGNAKVTGYIVGCVDGTALSKAVFGNEVSTNSNILLADDPYETNIDNCIPVQLPSGNVRTALNLVDNSDNYQKKVILTGDVEAYFSVAALKNTSAYEFVDEISHTLTVSDAGWATLYLGASARIPSTIEAYTVTTVNNGWVTLTQVTGVIPANTGIIVKADAGNYNFFMGETATADVTGNLLSGSTYNKNIEEEAYVLGNVDGVVGLYKAEMNQMDGTAWLNNANKAYLPASALTPAQQTAAFYGFDWDGTTGISEVKGESGNVKGIYDLTGRRVEAITAPGIYVVNGKKVLVK